MSNFLKRMCSSCGRRLRFRETFMVMGAGGGWKTYWFPACSHCNGHKESRISICINWSITAFWAVAISSFLVILLFVYAVSTVENDCLESGRSWEECRHG